MGVVFLKMLENPKKFKFVARFLSENSSSVKMDMTPEDLEVYLELQETVKKNDK